MEKSLQLKANNKLPQHLADGCVFVPRKIINDLRDGFINVTEFTLVAYLYLACDPYARCYVNTRMLAEDVFKDEGKYDYSGEVLRSLKRKGYIDFKSRQGKQGNFHVKVNDFLMSSGAYTSLSVTSVHPEAFLLNTKSPCKDDAETKTKTNLASDIQTGSDNNEKENNNENITNFQSLRSYLVKEVFKK